MGDSLISTTHSVEKTHANLVDNGKASCREVRRLEREASSRSVPADGVIRREIVS
jgi:hypothetical protein